MCALFYDYPLKISPKVHAISSSWCHAKSILAIVLNSKEVVFYDDEGELFTETKHIRNGPIRRIMWQPRGHNLAIGGEDGSISFWNCTTMTSRESNSPHKHPISLLQWAPSGNRLITGDESGLLIVWKIDARGQTSICTRYRRKGILNHCVFCTTKEQREKEMKSETFSQYVCPKFFVGEVSGILYYADDLDHIIELPSQNQTIDFLFFYEEKKRLVLLTQSLQLVQLQIEEDGTTKFLSKTKISAAADSGVLCAVWVGNGILATASCETFVRLWDVGNDQSSLLSLNSCGASVAPSDRISSIDFHPGCRLLACGTKEGKVIFWKYTGENWEVQYVASLTGSVLTTQWSPSSSILYVKTDSGSYTLHAATMHRTFQDNVAIIQTSERSISVERCDDNTVSQTLVETSIRIKSLAHDGQMILISSGTKGELFEIQKDDVRRISQFPCIGTCITLRGDSIYRNNGHHVEVCNTQGNVKTTISFTEEEGLPVCIASRSRYLVVATDRQLIKVFDVSRREPRQYGCSGNLKCSKIPSLEAARIRSLAINSDCTKISFLADDVEGPLHIFVPHDSVYVFFLESNVFKKYMFGNDKIPTYHFWDPLESRLLVCETSKEKVTKEDKLRMQKSLKNSDGKSGGTQDTDRLSTKEITTLFISLDHDILMQDSFFLEKRYDKLLGITVPYFYFISKYEGPQPPILLKTKTMQHFIGMTKVDDSTRQALIDFSYYITIGNMDEAYQAVKLIKNTSVWENMARMCVTTKRADVAEVCLANMGHARGAAALDAMKDKSSDPNISIAMLAIQLGMLDDAIRLYEECERYDLLSKLYQSIGQWEKAIDIARSEDRVHLRTLHYKYACHLESIGNISEAIKEYEMAGTEYRDVPRMLLEQRDYEGLHHYVEDSKDRRLFIWYGQYLESTEDYDGAIQMYKSASDFLCLVRVYCRRNQFDRATDVVKESGSHIAAFHLGQEFELQGQIPLAIQYYADSGCYSHAIRLAKDNNYDAELMSFALQSRKPSHAMECAKYFETKEEYSKAIQLYHNSGSVAKAIELCLIHDLPKELAHILEESGAGTAPSVLKRCADYLANKRLYENAIALYLRCKSYENVVELCLTNGIKLKEELVETIDLSKVEDEKENRRREKIIHDIARCFKKQGSFVAAAKKYTQFGDRVKAVKCLVKSNDMDKVVSFATLCRQKEVYILAANYLQSLDKVSADLRKNIIQFYLKAKAYGQLSFYYTSCSNTEIEENHNYEEGLRWLKEALDVELKLKKEESKTSEKLDEEIQQIESFLAAKKLKTENPTECIQMLEKLYDGANQGIKRGDLFGLIIEAYYELNDVKAIKSILKRMKDEKLIIARYVNRNILERIETSGKGENDTDAEKPKPSVKEETSQDVEEEIEEINE